MRPPIRKHLVTTFKRELEKSFPQFSSIELARGSPEIWEWQVTPRLFFYIVVTPFRDDERFALEIAWNEEHEFPWKSIGRELNLQAPCWRERLGVWSPPGKELVWDIAPEIRMAAELRSEARLRGEAVDFSPPPPVEVLLPRIDPLAADCLREFRELGLPLFKQVADSRGVDINL